MQNNQRPTPRRPAGGAPLRGSSNPQSTDAARIREYRRRRAYAEEMARRKAIEEKRRKAEKKHRREVFVGRLILFVIVLAVLAVLGCAAFFIHFNHTEEETPPLSIRYSLGGRESESLPADEAYRSGLLYVDFTAVAEYLGMAAVGDGDGMRYVIPSADSADSAGEGGEEDVAFAPGSDLAAVNGRSVRLDGIALVKGTQYRIPASFITEYMQGVTVTVDGKNVDIARTFTDGVADTVEFTLKSEKTVESIPEDTVIDAGGSVVNTPGLPEPDITVTFQTDLSAYEEYMNPADRDGFLILVNSENPLSADFVPSDLIEVKDTRKDGRATQKMVKSASMALEALYIEMRAAGYTDVSVTSAYRTYTYQNTLFNMYTDNEMKRNPNLSRAEAEAITVTYSSRPGTSEHQTGLCCDMHNLSSADQAFAKKDAYKWLTENAWKFGFILRFPDGKQDVTKVSFEPWHYRFVGRYHAKAMVDSGMCLEEYVAARSQVQ